jgi:hypothetical protein
VAKKKARRQPADVRFGSKPDMCAAKGHVWFTPPQADMCGALADVSFGPIADIPCLADFCDAAALADSWKIIGPSYISVARARPAPVPIPSDGLFRAGDRSRPFAMVSPMSHRRRRVLVDTPKGLRSAGFTVPESAQAADVSMALRRRGWSPYALRLDPEQHAWIALVMDWRRAA